MNKYLFFIIISLCFAMCRTPKTEDEIKIDTMVAEKPPMGWNSWDCLGFQANEAEIIAVADYMSENLKSFGWNYVVIDAGWYYPPGISSREGKMDSIPQSIDQYGRLIPDETKFPGSSNGEGFKSLAKYVHEKGLKFGIHVMRGIPWNAVAENTEIKGSRFKANDVVEPGNGCEWNSSMMGLKADHEGSQLYYNSLIELYAEWGVDFIKADDMIQPYHADEVEYLANALKQVNPSVVLSLSPGEANIKHAEELSRYSNMWRISGDLWDDWNLIAPQFDLCKKWTPWQKPGNWPDADMLPFGKLRKNGSDDWVASLLKDDVENLHDEYSRLNPSEMQTVMTLWCIARSPLMLGGYLPENDSVTTLLITNEPVIRVNQKGISSREVYRDEHKIIWLSNDSSDDNVIFLAVFNISDQPINGFHLTFSALGLLNNEYEIDDLWSGNGIGKHKQGFNMNIDTHGTRLFKLNSI